MFDKFHACPTPRINNNASPPILLCLSINHVFLESPPHQHRTLTLGWNPMKENLQTHNSDMTQQNWDNWAKWLVMNLLDPKSISSYKWIYGYAASSLLCETWHHADSQVPLKTSKLLFHSEKESCEKVRMWNLKCWPWITSRECVGQRPHLLNLRKYKSSRPITP